MALRQQLLAQHEKLQERLEELTQAAAEEVRQKWVVCVGRANRFEHPVTRPPSLVSCYLPSMFLCLLIYDFVHEGAHAGTNVSVGEQDGSRWGVVIQVRAAMGDRYWMLAECASMYGGLNYNVKLYARTLGLFDWYRSFLLAVERQTDIQTDIETA